MYIPDMDIGGSPPSSGGGSSSNSSRNNDPFSSTVQSALKKAFVNARKKSGITDFRGEAKKLFGTVEKKYNETPNTKAAQQITDDIGGALFDAQEHAGEFAVNDDQAIKAATEVATSIAQDIEKAFGRQSGVVHVGGNHFNDHTSHPSCFPAGTLITMADGSKKNIEDVNVWDRVTSFDTKTQTFTVGEIRELHQAVESSYYVINDGLLKVTGSHLLYVRKQDDTKVWTIIEPYTSLHLAVDDELYTEGQGWVRVTSVEEVPDTIHVYNLKTVDPHHTFFANGVLVHNGIKMEI